MTGIIETLIGIFIPDIILKKYRSVRTRPLFKFAAHGRIFKFQNAIFFKKSGLSDWVLKLICNSPARAPAF
jgi:hypothetical protein